MFCRINTCKTSFATKNTGNKNDNRYDNGKKPWSNNNKSIPNAYNY